MRRLESWELCSTAEIKLHRLGPATPGATSCCAHARHLNACAAKAPCPALGQLFAVAHGAGNSLCPAVRACNPNPHSYAIWIRIAYCLAHMIPGISPMTVQRYPSGITISVDQPASHCVECACTSDAVHPRRGKMVRGTANVGLHWMTIGFMAVHPHPWPCGGTCCPCSGAGRPSPAWLVLYWVTACLGVTIGYHRLLSPPLLPACPNGWSASLPPAAPSAASTAQSTGLACTATITSSPIRMLIITTATAASGGATWAGCSRTRPRHAAPCPA